MRTGRPVRQLKREVHSHGTFELVRLDRFRLRRVRKAGGEAQRLRLRVRRVRETGGEAQRLRLRLWRRRPVIPRRPRQGRALPGNLSN